MLLNRFGVHAAQQKMLVRTKPENVNLVNNGTDYANWAVTGTGTTKSASGIHLVDATNTETAKLTIAALQSLRAYFLHYTVLGKVGSPTLRQSNNLSGADLSLDSTVGSHVQDVTTKSGLTVKQLWNYIVGGSTSVDYTVDGLYEAPNHGVVQSPMVAFTFDDGWSTQYSRAFSYMSSVGKKGTIYLITNDVSTSNKVTKSQCDEMYAAGWCLGNHTNDHSYMGSFTKAQAAEKIQAGMNWLSSNGYSRGIKHFAYPGGQFNQNVLDAVFELDVLTARTIVEGTNGPVIPDLFKFNTYTMGGGAVSLAGGKSAIDAAISGGRACTLMFHRIVDTAEEVGTDGMNFLYSEFCELVDYAIASGIGIVTMDELYNALVINNPYTYV
jgi:peptidoglycan/xylan/chitin deacetylase (PgdA/CDA1 family)